MSERRMIEIEFNVPVAYRIPLDEVLDHEDLKEPTIEEVAAILRERYPRNPFEFVRDFDLLNEYEVFISFPGDSTAVEVWEDA